MSNRYLKDACAVALLVLAAFFVLRLVPFAHWTSIWMDREFTGWIAPLANRLSEGVRIYEDGFLLPFPPLAILLTRLISGGHATWLTEAYLNYACMSVIPIILFVAGRRFLSTSDSLAAAIATLLAFLTLPKSILYDGFVQLLIAIALLILSYRLKVTELSRRTLVYEIALAATTSLAILTKQSTGIFFSVGIILSLALSNFEVSHSYRTTINWCARFVLLLVVFTFASLFALSNWVSPLGLLHQVFIMGAETKGGALVLISNALFYLVDVFFSVAIAATFLGFARVFGSIVLYTAPNFMFPPRMRLAICAFAFFALLLAIHVFAKEVTVWGNGYWDPASGRIVVPNLIDELSYLINVADISNIMRRLALGLFCISLIVSTVNIRITDGYWPMTFFHRGTIERQFYFVAIAAMFAAAGQSLSVRDFRWAYDNNPFVFYVLAALIASYRSLPANPTRAVLAVTVDFALLMAFLIMFNFLALRSQFRAIYEANVLWPEIQHLAGARMRPQAEGMRRLIDCVRQLAPDPGRDFVLLLPEDPNVASWFERPRPKLTSAIVFVDQYWDRNVEVDLERLERELPKVIVIGPRGFWRSFFHYWHHNWGAERFIDLVQQRIIPRHYELAQSFPISFRGANELMDIYVRKVSAVDNFVFSLQQNGCSLQR